MDVVEARALLGLEAAPTWAEVRVAYRAQIGAAHPDRAGGSTARAARVNTAYAVLELAHREGRLHSDAPAAAPPGTTGPDEPPEVLDGDTVHLPVPPDEAFLVVLEACHEIGDVTYVDRSCAILEVLVRIEGEGVCSLVITLQGRSHGTDAYCTLEAIEHVAAPPVRPVVEALVSAIRDR